MAITGRTPNDCFTTFRTFVSGLISDTLVTQEPLLVTKVGTDVTKRYLCLGQTDADYVALRTTNNGSVFASIQQNLETLKTKDGGWYLKTQEYWYKVYDVRPEIEDEPLFRWEYVSKVPTGKSWGRHHFQIGKVHTGENGARRAVTVPMGATALDLNRLHLPTGFMLIEHFIRFLIVDLNVESRSGWESTLNAAENRFFTEFSTKTVPPP
jgi:hypothetical protein